MRAAWYEKLGPAREVLQTGEQPTVTAGPGEVRVKVHASGINPSDVKRRGGYGRYTKPDGPIVIPNSDGAGVVDQVGAACHTGSRTCFVPLNSDDVDSDDVE